jgi:ribosomal protein S18 acetylase RimI-like enzyme
MITVEWTSCGPFGRDHDVCRGQRAAAENNSRPPDSTSAIESLIARDPDASIVVERDGVLVGTIIAGWDGWRYHLYRLAVHPDHRRRGIARTLLTAAESRLSRLGASRLDAMVLDGNELGRSSGASSGYVRQGNWSRWVKKPAS